MLVHIPVFACKQTSGYCLLMLHSSAFSYNADIHPYCQFKIQISHKWQGYLPNYSYFFPKGFEHLHGSVENKKYDSAPSKSMRCFTSFCFWLSKVLDSSPCRSTVRVQRITLSVLPRLGDVITIKACMKSKMLPQS